MIDECINVIHERVNNLGPMSVTDFLLNNLQITNNNVPKLCTTQNACGQMESMIGRSIEELIDDAVEKFLV